MLAPRRASRGAAASRTSPRSPSAAPTRRRTCASASALSGRALALSLACFLVVTVGDFTASFTAYQAFQPVKTDSAGPTVAHSEPCEQPGARGVLHTHLAGTPASAPAGAHHWHRTALLAALLPAARPARVLAVALAALPTVSAGKKKNYYAFFAPEFGSGVFSCWDCAPRSASARRATSTRATPRTRRPARPPRALPGTLGGAPPSPSTPTPPTSTRPPPTPRPTPPPSLPTTCPPPRPPTPPPLSPPLPRRPPPLPPPPPPAPPLRTHPPPPPP